MRDLDRWKDKVEISLDGRQIFFLFFGSAVAACLIFVVGVLIGKRIEARALAMQPAPLEDPLAALDQLGDADEADEGLTFHKALSPARMEKAEKDRAEKADKSADRVEKGDKADKNEKSDKLVKTAEKTPDKADKPKGDKPDKADKSDKAVLTAMTDDDLDKPEASASKPEALAVKEPKGEGDVAAKKKADAKLAASAQAGKPLPPTKAQVVQSTPNPANKKGDAVKKADPLQSHFTLQLSAFPDKSDAEEFMHKIQTAGYKPFLVASEIPGKGVFFRVRVGDYASRQSAVDAKAEFERKQRIIAYVAKL